MNVKIVKPEPDEILEEIRGIREEGISAHEALLVRTAPGVSKKELSWVLGTAISAIMILGGWIWSTTTSQNDRIHTRLTEQISKINDIQIRVVTLLEVMENSIESNGDDIRKLQPDVPRFDLREHNRLHHNNGDE